MRPAPLRSLLSNFACEIAKQGSECFESDGPLVSIQDIKAFMTGFRATFPDLNFWGTAELIAEDDYVVGRWENGGTHTGPAFNDFLVGSLPPATGRKMHFTGTTVLRIKDGRIAEETGLDDGVTALQQLGLIRVV